MKFTKEHTMQMKGIAIIILLFHHCFLNAQRWATVPYEKLATTKGWGYYPISFAPFSSHTIQYLASFSKICVAMFVFMTCIISQRNTFVKTFTLYTPQNHVFFCQPVYNYPV